MLVYGIDPQVGQSLDGLILSISAPHFVTLSMGILFPLLRRIEVSTLWSSLFLRETFSSSHDVQLKFLIHY